MSAYSHVDPALTAWALANDLTWFSRYHDDTEVRMAVVGEGMRRAQIWIDPPDGDLVAVHAAQHIKRREWNSFNPLPCALGDLPAVLDEALKQATKWVAESHQGAAP